MKKYRRHLMLLLLLPVLLLFAYGFWYTHRPLPEAVEKQALFQGIVYSRRILPEIPLVYHVIEIDLQAEGIGFFVTPRDELDGFDFAARTTSQFLLEYDTQIAINADYLEPWHDYHLFDYYPHEGDAVNARGLSINAGQVMSEGYADSASTLYFTAANQPSFERPDAPMLAISGHPFLLKDGQVAIEGEHPYFSDRHPRTAIGFNEEANRLILVIVDGRQPSYSIGLSLWDLAALMQAEGAYWAVNLDGGGSSTLVMEGTEGEAILLNSPIHNRIPYRERPIANHFGVFAMPLP